MIKIIIFYISSVIIFNGCSNTEVMESDKKNKYIECNNSISTYELREEISKEVSKQRLKKIQVGEYKEGEINYNKLDGTEDEFRGDGYYGMQNIIMIRTTKIDKELNIVDCAAQIEFNNRSNKFDIKYQVSETTNGDTFTKLTYIK